VTAARLEHWAGALLRASQATTRQQARDHINTAVLRGATLDQAREALRLWDAAHPLDAPTCACSHTRAYHGTDRHGRPLCHGSVVCGCAQFQPEETR
jgi:hypothetical protein